MAGDQVAAVLHLGAALEPGLEQVAELGHDRQGCSEGGGPEHGPAAAEGEGPAHQGRTQHAAAEPGPGLLRAQGRCEARPADGAPGEVGAGVGGPDDEEQPQDQGGTLGGVAQPEQGQGRQADIEHAAGGAVDRRAPHQGGKAGAHGTAGTEQHQGRRHRIVHAQNDRRRRDQDRGPEYQAAHGRVRVAGQPRPFAGHHHHRHQEECGEEPATQQHIPDGHNGQGGAGRDALAQGRIEALSRPTRHTAALCAGTRAPLPAGAPRRSRASSPARRRARYRPAARGGSC